MKCQDSYLLACVVSRLLPFGLLDGPDEQVVLGLPVPRHELDARHEVDGSYGTIYRDVFSRL